MLPNRGRKGDGAGSRGCRGIAKRARHALAGVMCACTLVLVGWTSVVAAGQMESTDTSPGPLDLIAAMKKSWLSQGAGTALVRFDSFFRDGRKITRDAIPDLPRGLTFAKFEFKGDLSRSDFYRYDPKTKVPGALLFTWIDTGDGFWKRTCYCANEMESVPITPSNGRFPKTYVDIAWRRVDFRPKNIAFGPLVANFAERGRASGAWRASKVRGGLMRLEIPSGIGVRVWLYDPVHAGSMRAPISMVFNPEFGNALVQYRLPEGTCSFGAGWYTGDITYQKCEGGWYPGHIHEVDRQDYGRLGQYSQAELDVDIQSFDPTIAASDSDFTFDSLGIAKGEYISDYAKGYYYTYQGPGAPEGNPVTFAESDRRRRQAMATMPRAEPAAAPVAAWSIADSLWFWPELVIAGIFLGVVVFLVWLALRFRARRRVAAPPAGPK
jgi:hypothetical protein